MAEILDTRILWTPGEQIEAPLDRVVGPFVLPLHWLFLLNKLRDGCFNVYRHVYAFCRFR